MLDSRFSDNDVSKRDIPSFIEPRPPLVQNPFMRPRPQKGTNLLQLFEEDSELEESECPDLVQVYLRLKPCSTPNTLYEVRSDRCLVTSLDTATAGHGRRTQHNVSKMYTFSKIFGPECNQKEIFEAVVKENLKKLPDGHNFTLLTYGASGSGKTYTLMGTVGAPGLVPRSLEYVFRLVDATQQPSFKPAEGGADKLSYAEQDFELQWVKRLRHVSAPLRDKYRRMSAQLHNDLTVSSIDLSNRIRHYVWVSFVEIYNEAIYDLLAPPDKRTKLRIREDSSGHVYVKGATQAFVRSGEEAYDVMVAGKHNLVVAATGVHAHSSRSHCIFTITMLTETEGDVRTSYVRLCDLAGCERARATRNTGARMAESRAINSSLHVLERCLHMLRRKQRQRQDALVPYRESKLTRLLGSGLSGARGEAVSMVVTLNPAPEYAHETKHVLTLAAVAQDIQINNTMFASTLESSTQDTTVNCSSEVMKLRADNERLHFELVQAQSRNKELMAAMEERQQQLAHTMRELVEEAKDLTKQYYEAQLQAARTQMEEMIEEYENRLEQAKVAAPSGAGTPSRHLQNKIAELMTEIAVLEETLTAERLARARAEKEVQHLRTCIEERDEKAFKESIPDDDLQSDSDHESDEETDDPFNESMEPVFKKDLNRSLAVQDKLSANNSIHTIDNIDEEDESEVLDKSNDTIKNDDSIKDTSQLIDDVNLSEERNATHNNDKVSDETFEDTRDNKSDVIEMNSFCNDVKLVDPNFVQPIQKPDLVRDTYLLNDVDDGASNNTSDLRGTYFVNDALPKLTKINSYRGTYCVKDPVSDERSLSKTIDGNIHESFSTETKDDVLVEMTENRTNTEKPEMKVVQEEAPETVRKIVQSLKSTQSNDSSLRQFERLELAAKTCEDSASQNETVFGNINILKEKRQYFDDNVSEVNVVKEIEDDFLTVKANKEKKRTYFDNIDVEPVAKKANEIKQIDDERSLSIVKDVVSDNFKPSTMGKLIGENFIKLDTLSSIHKTKLTKKHDSVDIFDGFDSPAPVTNKLDNVEIARASIERLVLHQQSKKSLNHDTKTIPEEFVEDNAAANTEGTLATEAVCLVMNETNAVNDIKLVHPNNETDIKTASDIKIELKIEPQSSVDEPNQTVDGSNASKVDSTIEEFEKLYKDVTTSRATEFELVVVSQEINESSSKTEDKDEIKYNLRHKSRIRKDSDNRDEILAESTAKCENQPRKRALRLRRRKNDGDDERDRSDAPKLKDIVNLQNEYCDVTMDVPATKKDIKDIPSPEKCEGENLPPRLGIQSCPSKSVTRSRRKLFTPRAEPLEESLGQTGDSNERLYVPRPSYHRPRARRKL